jgi:hypothetical protein
MFTIILYIQEYSDKQAKTMISSTCFKFPLDAVFPTNEEEKTFAVGLRSLVAQVVLFDCGIFDD